MTPELTNLWKRLEGYTPDNPSADFPFSQRLARDNAWSPDFTNRVIEEYRRFAFLAVAAGHPVTPSDAVDQAWHLHLLYTRSYWEVFCPKVLRTPLHHHPTAGGFAERAKFNDWYHRTLRSYREFFGSEPPPDIWPSAEQRFGEDIHYIRVNAHRHWILRRPRWLGRVARRGGVALRALTSRWVGLTALVALALGSVGCRASGSWLSSVGLTGREFLGVFILLWAALHVLGVHWRRHLSLPCPVPGAPVPQLDPYAVTFLSGGAELTLNAAILNLTRSAVIDFGLNDGRLHRTGVLRADAHPVERGVYEIIGESERTVAEVSNRACPGLTPIAAALEDAGFVPTGSQAFKAVWLPTVLMLVVPVVGFLRILQGSERHEPVGITYFLTLLAIGVALSVFAQPIRRSQRGEAVLRQLRDQHRELELAPGADLDAISLNAFPLILGLFGASFLAGTPLDAMHQKLTRGSGTGGGGEGCGGDGGGGCGGCGGCG